MKKLCSIALLVASVFSFGLVTPLAAGVLDTFVDGFVTPGPVVSIITKGDIRVSNGVDVPINDSIIRKRDVRITKGMEVPTKETIIRKRDVRITK